MASWPFVPGPETLEAGRDTQTRPEETGVRTMWDPWQDLHRIVDAVSDTPSIFNDWPWQFRVVSADRIELHAAGGALGQGLVPAGAGSEGGDPPAVPGRPDVLAREAYISCGAALYNLRAAIRVAGHDHTVWLLPNPRKRPTLLASVEIMTGRIAHVPPGAEELYEAMLLRRTSREPLRAPRVPLPILVEMENAAAAERGWLRIVHPGQARYLLSESARAAQILLDADRWDKERPEIRHRLAEFQAARGRVNGVSRPGRGDLHDTAGPAEAFQPAERFGWGPQAQLMALSTDDDRPLDWLRAGQALQRALLTATRYSMSAAYGRMARSVAEKDHGLPARRFLPLRRRAQARFGVAVSPLTQLLQLEDLRGEDRHWPRKWYYRWPWWWYPEVPQMVLRVGYVPVEPHRVSRELAQPLVDERVQPPDEYYPSSYRRRASGLSG